MSINDDSQLSRILIERKLCDPKEISLVREEQRELSRKGQNEPLARLLMRHGYITQSQLTRLDLSMEEDSMYRPAQQIPGYQILGRVGQGAMAVVFKARQLSLDRIVAIKVLPRRLSENNEFVDRFYREGRAAAKLNHPNIVGAFDVGEAGGRHYFVMEFIDGNTVYDSLGDGKFVPEERALDIVEQVAKALGHAHSLGLIHRDVKPKNIMITNEGVVKLADMGLARELGDYKTAAAEAGRAYGTPYYISPEQIRGDIHIDCRADIYALGATFYHMVTGKVPFDGSTPSAVMHKHLKEPLIPPDHINTRLSSGIGEIIEVMMAKNAADRYATTDELLADIKAVKNGEPPFQARQKYDHELLQSLATSGEVIEADSFSQRAKQQNGQAGSGATIGWVVAGLSIVVNIVLVLALVL